MKYSFNSPFAELFLFVFIITGRIIYLFLIKKDPEEKKNALQVIKSDSPLLILFSLMILQFILSSIALYFQKSAVEGFSIGILFLFLTVTLFLITRKNKIKRDDLIRSWKNTPNRSKLFLIILTAGVLIIFAESVIELFFCNQ